MISISNNSGTKSGIRPSATCELLKTMDVTKLGDRTIIDQILSFLNHGTYCDVNNARGHQAIYPTLISNFAYISSQVQGAACILD